MTIKQYRKKPVVIWAVQLTLTPDSNFGHVAIWCGGTVVAGRHNMYPTLHISTLEGVMMANVGDWIIQGVAGEFYPCKHDIFIQTYEPLTAEVDNDA